MAGSSSGNRPWDTVLKAEFREGKDYYLKGENAIRFYVCQFVTKFKYLFFD